MPAGVYPVPLGSSAMWQARFPLQGFVHQVRHVNSFSNYQPIHSHHRYNGSYFLLSALPLLQQDKVSDGVPCVLCFQAITAQEGRGPQDHWML